MPKTMADQIKWTVAFDYVIEEPIKCFSRIVKIVGVLASRGVVKTVANS